MSKIKVLDKIIANRISAGEVVERPSSVVKELFENSVDAGADKIIIEIEEGGTKSITITDNGHGIEKEDVKTAFLSHSTSKIKNVEDLGNIATLGFRGEALASISSVSQIEMTTKTLNESTATKIIIEGGEEGLIEEISGNKGTKIIVKNIFFNTPARRKFLRKNKTEETDITNLVERFLLSNSNIAIKYVVDGKIIYNTMGSGMFDNIYTIYGKEVADNLILINVQRGKFRLVGYIGKPEISKPNRTYQTLMINNRIVQNFMVNNAVASAYENYLMKNRFPFFVLNLIMPYDNVDVNVHPSKQEVKFENTSLIYSFFAGSVLEALQNANHIKSIQDNDENGENKLSNSPKIFKFLKDDKKLDNLNNIEDIAGKSDADCREDNNPANQKKVYQFKNETHENFKNFGESSKSNFSDNVNKDFSDILKLKHFNPELKSNTGLDLKSDESNISKIFLKKFKDESNQKNSFTKLIQVQDNNQISSLQSQSVMEQTADVPVKIVGTLFNTYIITEKGDKFYIIDQHAGHERRIFDKFVSEIENNDLNIQELLVAYTFNCNTFEYQFFIENLEKLENLGFYIEPFGHNNLKLTKIPMLLYDLNLKEFIDDIKSNITSFNKKSTDILKNFIAQKACKSAVKAGDILPLSEIVSFVKDLENSSVLLCPHGRPIIIEIPKKQLEKWFKRLI